MRHTPVTSASHWAGVLAALAVLLLFALAACSGAPEQSGAGAAVATPAMSTGTGTMATFGFAEEPPADWFGDVSGVGRLPPEARQTLALVASDGPYPYRQDGSTFQNREGLLPDREAGFYREFTVETPGSPDRGARRLVVGDDAAVYYTADHYDSFSFVGP